ncbi:polymer-forming cytoskeletal protein [Microbacteriaceae bacterium]|nr:polymer-forming cytoskeletal protein [Candidatus Saccharibacteria bacterium]
MRLKLGVIVASMFVSALALTVNVMAEKGHSYDQTSVTTVAKDKTVDGAFYGFSDTVIVNGTVKGDVYCGGQNITINGTVEGDVICAGQSIKLSGTVNGDVRLAGQNVSVDARILGSLSTFGQNIDITKDAIVDQDFNGAGQSVTINGVIKRDVMLGGDRVVVEGSVGRNLDGRYNSLTITSDAKVGGDATFESRNSSIADGSVSGETKNTPLPQNDKKAMRGLNVAAALYGFVAMLVFAMILVLLAPGPLNRATGLDIKHFWQSMLIGFAAGIVVPITILFIAFTFVGLPVALFAGITWLAILLLSSPVFSYYIGRKIMGKSTKNAVLVMLVGALVVLLAMNVPLLGILVWLVAGMAGSGMILIALSRHWQKPNYTVR